MYAGDGQGMQSGENRGRPGSFWSHVEWILGDDAIYVFVLLLLTTQTVIACHKLSTLRAVLPRPQG